ncbi:MAG: hypothetical protein IPL59_11510 [Candidatus Competibacteraceae bacterium]|nr:hypothetical protein [Candidatus Competibacteraceae bacterium]
MIIQYPLAYDAMSPEELAQFVQVDGHGYGTNPRYCNDSKVFRNVRGEVRYDVINLVEEYQAAGQLWSAPAAIVLGLPEVPERLGAGNF